jgi:hypothetical protein
MMLGLSNWELSESAVSTSTPKARKPITFSSNQLVLGIISTPRGAHLITSPSKMRHDRGDPSSDVEAGLGRLYGEKPRAHLLESSVFAIVLANDLDPHKTKNHEAYIEWLKPN